MSRRRRRASSPSPVPAPPALEDDDLLHEILLRLPPQPQHLLRASVVSKRWRGLATDPQFLRHFRIHHGKPPLLGLFSDFDGKFPFRSTLDPPCRIPPGRFPLPVNGHDAWRLLDCRHGRVLFHDLKSRLIVVWDPITNNYRNLVYPPQFLCTPIVLIHRGAVLCAVAGDQGHLHVDCPFKVVLLSTLCSHHQVVTAASVYFSETRVWSDFLSTAPSLLNVSWLKSPATLVGNVIHWMSVIVSGGGIQFDLDSHRLAVIQSPPGVHGSVRIIHSENGGVALASLSSIWGDRREPHFQTWEMMVNSYGVARWVLRKTLKLQNVLGLGFRISNDKSSIVGYAEDIRAIFLQVDTSVYMLQLDSLQSKELFKRDKLLNYYPFTSFYTEGYLPIGQLPSDALRFSGKLGAKKQAKHVL